MSEHLEIERKYLIAMPDTRALRAACSHRGLSRKAIPAASAHASGNERATAAAAVDTVKPVSRSPCGTRDHTLCRTSPAEARSIRRIPSRKTSAHPVSKKANVPPNHAPKRIKFSHALFMRPPTSRPKSAALFTFYCIKNWSFSQPAKG